MFDIREAKGPEEKSMHVNLECTTLLFEAILPTNLGPQQLDTTSSPAKDDRNTLADKLIDEADKQLRNPSVIPTRVKEAYIQALAIKENLYGKTDKRLLPVIDRLANLGSGTSKESLQWKERAIEILKVGNAENHLELTARYIDLADCYRLLGDNESSEKISRLTSGLWQQRSTKQKVEGLGAPRYAVRNIAQEAMTTALENAPATTILELAKSLKDLPADAEIRARLQPLLKKYMPCPSPVSNLVYQPSLTGPVSFGHRFLYPKFSGANLKTIADFQKMDSQQVKDQIELMSAWVFLNDRLKLDTSFSTTLVNSTPEDTDPQHRMKKISQYLKDLQDVVLLRERISKIERLHVVEVTDTDMANLKVFSNLNFLQLLSSKNVTDNGLKHLEGLTELESLDLRDTDITDAGLQRLANLPLKTLNLTSTKITNTGLMELSGLPKLTTLSLSFTKITDAGLEHLKGLKALNMLDLSFTKITDAGLKEVINLPGLRTLNLEGTAITDNALSEIRRPFPLLRAFK